MLGIGMAIDFDSPEKSYELFKKGKREGTWDPDDIDLSQDQADWETLNEDEQEMFLGISSGFYEGEEDVTRTLAPYMYALEGFDDDAPFDAVQEEMYLSQQVYEEAKHTDFFSRYFEEVFGTQDTEPLREGGYQEAGYSTEDLYDTADALVEAATAGDQRCIRHELAEAYMNYMGIVEAQLARAGYIGFDMMAASKADELGRETVLPGFQRAVAKVRQDESRHIENGRWVMGKLAESDHEVAPEVLEPRLKVYIRDRVLSPREVENPFERYDQEYIGDRSLQYLQDTVDAIGTDRFGDLTDVRAYVRRAREEGADAAAADDD
jgi:ribonucleoside-diphosphate reductase beta chain